MSSEPVIVVRGLGKSYPMYARPHHRMLELLLGSRSGRWRREHRALDGVAFEVRRGETVGIVGRNGSGKSTLLQILCGTLAPSSGTVQVSGRIAALLELGAGFNPEFTGRENVFLYGTVLGLTRAEVASRFEAIAAFADIGGFIDQPVRTYSSGMFVRLAFAVAIHVDPEVLVVDEALSVGDEAFQRKCFGRIEQLRERGVTILFVSHSAGTVVDLCERALWLDGGELLADGPARRVVGLYQKLAFAPADRHAEVRAAVVLEASGEPAVAPVATGLPSTPAAGFDPTLRAPDTVAYVRNGALIREPRVETPEGQPVNLLVPGQRYRLRFVVDFSAAAVCVRFGMMVRTTTGVEVGGAVSEPEGAGAAVGPGDRCEVGLEFSCRMQPGTYFINAGVVARREGADVFLDRLVDALMVRVLPGGNPRVTGLLDLDPGCQLQWVTP